MPDGRQIRYSIVTPEHVLVEGQAEFVCLPGHDGEFGILFNRSPLLVRLAPGIVRVRQGSREQWYFVAGGFGDVLQNCVTVLTPRALTAEQVRLEDVEQVRLRAVETAAPDEAGQRRRMDARAEARALDRLAARAGS